MANGFARLRGNKSAGAPVLLVSMSNVKPGYKNGLIFGNWSEVISSVSLASVVRFFGWIEGFVDTLVKVSKSQK